MMMMKLSVKPQFRSPSYSMHKLLDWETSEQCLVCEVIYLLAAIMYSVRVICRKTGRPQVEEPAVVFTLFVPIQKGSQLRHFCCDRDKVTVTG